MVLSRKNELEADVFGLRGTTMSNSRVNWPGSRLECRRKRSKSSRSRPAELPIGHGYEPTSYLTPVDFAAKAVVHLAVQAPQKAIGQNAQNRQEKLRLIIITESRVEKMKSVPGFRQDD